MAKRIEHNVDWLIRQIDAKLAQFQLHRSDLSVRDKWTTSDPRILELHHLTHHRDRGSNQANNLAVLCSKCHDQVHAGKFAAELALIATELCRTSSP